MLMSEQKKKKVIFVDDDHGPMDYFVAAMQLRGLEVQHLDHADTAIDYLRDKNSLPPDLFIIDVMMPPGKYLSAEQTNDGVDTGFFLIEECQSRFPHVPVLCLTATRSLEEVKANVGDVRYVHKLDHPPFVFADKVIEFLNAEKTRSGSPEKENP